MKKVKARIKETRNISFQKFNWNILSGIAAIFGIVTSIVYTSAKVLAYLYKKSYLIFWSIPEDFMHQGNSSFLYTLAIILSISIVLICASLLLTSILKQKKEKCEKILVLVITGLICGGLTAIIALLLVSQSLKSYLSALSTSQIGYLLFFFCLCGGIETTFLWVIGKAYLSSITKQSIKTFKDLKTELAGGIIALFIAFNLAMLMAYSYSKQICRSTVQFNVIDTETTKQVILYQDTDTYIVKDCYIQDNVIYINIGSYKLIDSTNVPVQIVTFNSKNDDSVFKRVSSTDFQNLINESNSNEDTPS